MFLLAQNYDPNMDPTGWWMSEKLDGIRAMWDGQRVISRNGNQFAAPPWFVENFPPFKLDGELWLGRGQFDETSSIVRSSMDKGWNRIRFMMFDIPEARAGLFEERQAILHELVKTRKFHNAIVVPQSRCLSKPYFDKALDLAIAAGAEGLMLRKPKSLYIGKRSATLLKAKRMHDAEAVVVGHQPGEGKFTSMMGALECLTDRGVAFRVGTGFTDAQRTNPPPIKSVITFRYQELSKDGVPRFPAFVRIKVLE